MALPNLRTMVNNNAKSAIEGGGAALVTLALGGSKAEAALAGVGQALLHKVLGPMSLVAGAASGMLKGIVALTQGFANMGMGSAAGMEKVQNQLRVMLKGLDAAKQRVREMQAFSVKTPFSMKDVVAGNRVMESMGRGALSTKESMELVGDAAAQAGTDFETMAVYVGRLYDGLAAGRPVGEVLFRLAELGVVSGQARTSLEQLQASGAGFAEVWRVVEGELKRGAGTMAYTSRTLEGMQQATADAQDQLQAAFSMNFMQGQKEALEAQAKTMQNLTPVAEDVGMAFSRVINVTSTLRDRALAFVTGFKAVQVVMGFTARVAAILTTAIVGLAVAIGVVKVWRMVGGILALGKAAAVARLATSALGRSLLLLVTGPVGIGIAVLIGLTAALSMVYDKSVRAAEALREYEGATRSMITAMQAQAQAVKNLDDLGKAYQATLAKLKEAYNEEAAAAEAGKGKQQRAARERVAALKEQLNYLDQIKRVDLEQPQFVTDTMSGMKGNQRNVAQAEREAARGVMTPEERARDMAKEADEMQARREAAAKEIAGMAAYGDQGKEQQNALGKNQAAQAEVKAAMNAWKAQKEGLGAGAEQGARSSSLIGGGYGGDQSRPPTEAETKKAQALEAVLQELARHQAELAAEETDLAKASLTLAEATGSEVAVMMEKLKVWDLFLKAEADLAAAEEERVQATKEADSQDKKAKVEALTKAYEEQQEVMDRLAKLAVEAKMTPVAAQAMRAEIERRKQEVNGDIMNRPEEVRARAAARDEARRAKIEGDQAELDVGVAQAGMNGRLAQEQASLDADRERLRIAAELENMDERVYAARKKILDIDQYRLDIQKEIAKAGREGEFKAGGLDLQVQAARLGGRSDEAAALEEKAAVAREEAGRRAREQELQDSGLSYEDAVKQTQKEFERNRMSRAMDKEGGLLGIAMGEHQVADSMARIGGGGNTYGGGDIKKVTDRLDRLIQAVRDQEHGDARLQ